MHETRKEDEIKKKLTLKKLRCAPNECGDYNFKINMKKLYILVALHTKRCWWMYEYVNPRRFAHSRVTHKMFENY